MIVIVGTLDTKGDKIAYLKQLIENKGAKTLIVDCGILGEPFFTADISREEVAKAAGTNIGELSSIGNEAEAVRIMSRGTTAIVAELYYSGRLQGLVGVGGTMATSSFVSVANVLPFGVPKVFFCTTAFGDLLRPRVVPPDLMVVPAVSDIWGLNSLTKRTLENAAGAILGATQLYKESEDVGGRTFIGITTLGTSELKYIVWLIPLLQKTGKEAVAFHIGGGQGWTFEHLIRKGLITGALDLCFMDFCPDNIAKQGFLSVSGRLEAAGEQGIPQVVAPGAVYTLAWHKPPEYIPDIYHERKGRWHNELAWGIERTPEELAETAELMAVKLNKGRGPRAIVIPKLGISEFDRPGQPFHNPERVNLFTQALKSKLSPEVKLVELNAHINDRIFAEEVAKLYYSLAE
jgi:uncharacterized protein (UPF0261 family)